MKMRKLFLLTLLLLFIGLAPQAHAQLFLDDFNYTLGDALTSHGYLVSSGGTTNVITVVSPGLTFAGYPSSGVGYAAHIDTTGQDVYKAFPADSVGSVYLAFMMN